MTSDISTRLTSGPLITTDWPNRSFEFYSMDTEERFRKHANAVLQDNNPWIYLNKQIHYKFNSQGYRTKEWSDIDWQESVVIFGCSIVLGEGLAEEDTIASQLSKIINRPVINLGVSGTGISFSFYNSVMLYRNLPTPYAVVQLWSNPSRMELYSKNCVELHMSMNYSASAINKNFYESWISYPENPNTHMLLQAQASRCIWESKTQYCELSLFGETRDLLGCDHVHILDYARDLGHPGIETAKSIAELIADKIK